MRQRRYPLLLDTDYPPEHAVLRALHASAEGERAAFLRALILLGHREIARHILTKMSTQSLGECRSGYKAALTERTTLTVEPCTARTNSDRLVLRRSPYHPDFFEVLVNGQTLYSRAARKPPTIPVGTQP